MLLWRKVNMAKLRPLKKVPEKPKPKVKKKPSVQEQIRDILLIISSKDIPAMRRALNSLGPWLGKVPQKITRNASNYITKKEYKIGNRILEINYTRDSNNYITDVEPRWLDVSKFSTE